MISFVGESFAPRHLRNAAKLRGLVLTDLEKAKLVFVSEDTPTQHGVRDLDLIERLTRETVSRCACPVVLTSQVPPGFTRSLGLPIYHMAETLRVKDAEQRALEPEQFIIGCEVRDDALPTILEDYLNAYGCPVMVGTYEDAEFAKIAINMSLAAQVDSVNRLSLAAQKCGADWQFIKQVLQHDKRMGAYLTPGDWKQSQHLLRDYVTLLDIERG